MKSTTYRFILPILFFLGLLATLDEPAVAQTREPEGMSVEVPEALGPEAMSALVSNLDQEQTDALTKLMELLSSAAAGAPDAAAAEPAVLQAFSVYYSLSSQWAWLRNG